MNNPVNALAINVKITDEQLATLLSCSVHEYVEVTGDFDLDFHLMYTIISSSINEKLKEFPDLERVILPSFASIKTVAFLEHEFPCIVFLKNIQGNGYWRYEKADVPFGGPYSTEIGSNLRIMYENAGENTQFLRFV
jgi:hypothetical protein